MPDTKAFLIALLVASAALLPAVSAGAPTGAIADLERRYYLASEEERPAILAKVRGLGTREALDFNLKLLTYPDVKVRMEAVESLRAWGQPGLAAAFAGMENPEINWICESLFVGMGVRVIPFLTDMLEDPDPFTRARAVYLLGLIGDPVSFGPLYDHLKDPSREVRIQVIQALSDMGNPEALGPILELFDTEDVGLADFVLQAAERFGPRAAKVLEVALGSKKERVRGGAAMALGRIRVPESLPHLVRALDDPKPSVRRNAAVALGNYRDMAAADGLIRALADNDLEVQDYATTGLGYLSPDIVPRLLDLLRSPNTLVRKNAVVALRKTKDRRALAPILQALDDPDPTVRMFAVTAIIEFKDPTALRPLIHRIKNEQAIVWLVSYAFMEMGNQAVDELLSATGDQDFCSVRNTILLQMGNTAVDVLIHRAMTDSGSSRLTAVAILGELASSAAVPVLGELLGDDEVGWVAAQSLSKMGFASWDTLYNAARFGKGAVRESALDGIARYEDQDPRLTINMVDCLDLPDDSLARAVSVPLVRGGEETLNLVAEGVGRLGPEGSARAMEILCRVKDMAAIETVSRVLFPEPWAPQPMDTDRLFALRQTYAQRGGLETVRKRIKQEMGGAGGGQPWERVAP